MKLKGVLHVEKCDTKQGNELEPTRVSAQTKKVFTEKRNLFNNSWYQNKKTLKLLYVLILIIKGG